MSLFQSHAHLALSLLLVSATSCGKETSTTPPDASKRQAGCITTPQAYVVAWEQRKAGCVDPRLFATLYTRPPKPEDNAETWLYPESFDYAWAFSNTNLERFLFLQSQYGGDSREAQTKVAVAIAEFIGFADLDNFGLGDYGPFNMGIYVLPQGETALVPSWETWVQILESYGLSYPLDAQIELVSRYSRLSEAAESRRHEDVVSVYEQLSGCARATMLSSPDPDPPYAGLGYAPQSPNEAGAWDGYIGCSPAYQAAVRAAGDSPYTYTGPSSNAPTSIRCFENFFSSYQGPRDAMALRAILAQCQDASHLNTGAGLGYNTYPNPLVCAGYVDNQPTPDEQPVIARYTGREFILPNRQLGNLPEWAYLELNAPSELRPYLLSGWCDQDQSG